MINYNISLNECNVKIIKSPLFIQLSPLWKKYYINLNNYRNWHFQVSNKIKQKYKEIISEQIKDNIFPWKIQLSYQLFQKDNRRIDKWNILSITQKFFLDSLTENWCIVDDNDKIIDLEVFLPSLKDENKEWYVEIKIIYEK